MHNELLSELLLAKQILSMLFGDFFIISGYNSFTVSFICFFCSNFFDRLFIRPCWGNFLLAKGNLLSVCDVRCKKSKEKGRHPSNKISEKFVLSQFKTKVEAKTKEIKSLYNNYPKNFGSFLLCSSLIFLKIIFSKKI